MLLDLSFDTRFNRLGFYHAQGIFNRALQVDRVQLELCWSRVVEKLCDTRVDASNLRFELRRKGGEFFLLHRILR